MRSVVLEGALAHVSHGEDVAWEAELKADEALAKLSLTTGGIGPDSLVATLSGGQRKRVALARELVRQPDLLLLDEPTNHLDVESIVWLEELLSRAPFATVTVTHDRLFLTRVATRILELDRRNPGGLLSVPGGFAKWLEAKEALLAAQESRESSLRNVLRRETEWLQARAEGAGDEAEGADRAGRGARRGDRDARRAERRADGEDRLRRRGTGPEAAPRRRGDLEGLRRTDALLGPRPPPRAREPRRPHRPERLREVDAPARPPRHGAARLGEGDAGRRSLGRPLRAGARVARPGGDGEGDGLPGGGPGGVPRDASSTSGAGSTASSSRRSRRR